MHGNEYIKTVTDTITRAWDEQKPELEAAADMLADTVKAKHNVFIFGCSHAGILAEEVFYRTGGLAVINPVMFPGFILNTRPITMTSRLERLPGLGKIILEENRISKDDLLIIHSVSGRNTVPVEMAIEARKAGIHTFCITNLEYSKSVTSRHPDGLHLFEVCDLVIDNMGVVGDAAVNIDSLPEAIGPTSTAVGAALINGIVIEAVERLIADNILPPVFMSANLDGGGEHNKKIFDEYGDNIFYQ